jgi:hypothetical protein
VPPGRSLAVLGGSWVSLHLDRGVDQSTREAGVWASPKTGATASVAAEHLLGFAPKDPVCGVFDHAAGCGDHRLSYGGET